MAAVNRKVGIMRAVTCKKSELLLLLTGQPCPAGEFTLLQPAGSQLVKISCSDAAFTCRFEVN
jgi:hypothetical protein